MAAAKKKRKAAEPVLKTNPLTAWSYSRYTCYKQCPALAKYRFIDKLPEPKSPALENGIAVHKDAELYLKGTKKTVPPTLIKLRDEFKKLKKAGANPEASITLDKNWEETDWFAQNAWLRLKIDAEHLPEKRTLWLCDFKTGKVRLNEGYEEQLELYAAAAFSVFDIDVVKTELWFVDNGKIYGRGDNDDENQEDFIYNIDEHDKLVKNWNMRIKPFFNDTRFTPTPNFACRWCSFSSSKGGPCKY